MNRSRGHLIAVALLLTAALPSGPRAATDLGGSAEDLWGDTINLAAHNRGMTVIYPFSPSD